MWAWATAPNIKGVLHELLALLERHNVPATFFVSGVCARQNKSEIIEIRDAGHEIALHGYRHVPYNMPRAGMEADLYQAVSVYNDLDIEIKGFRAPWLIASMDVYTLAEQLGLKYVSNYKSTEPLHRVKGYDFLEIPIYLEDQALLKDNPVETLMNSSEAGRTFEFHLLYVRHTFRILDAFLSKLQMQTATLSQIAEGKQGLGLSFDIAYLSRWELIKKIVA